MSGPWVDIYVLAGERSKRLVDMFAETWLSGFEGGDTFPYPDEMDTAGAEVIYKSPFELVDRLIEEPKCDYSIYWFNSNKEAPVKCAMLFFTSNGAMIAGLALDDSVVVGQGGDVERQKPSDSTRALLHLARVMEGVTGYATIEQPPPLTIKEFEEIVQTGRTPKLVNGQLIFEEAKS